MNTALRKTVFFIAAVFAFMATVVTFDIQERLVEKEGFVNNLDVNGQLAEVVGLGYEVVNVKEEGNYFNPDINAELEMYGFTLFANFEKQELTTVDLIVACEKGAKKGSKVCYSQQLYPEQATANYIK